MIEANFSWEWIPFTVFGMLFLVWFIKIIIFNPCKPTYDYDIWPELEIVSFIISLIVFILIWGGVFWW